MTWTRRSVLRVGAAALATAAFPPSIRRALAIPARRRAGTIADVEHVVILMQENRAFDHYFGTFPGARGFGDRFTIPLPGGRSVWEQQDGSGSTILPFHLDSTLGNAQRSPGTPHFWTDAHLAWNDGATGHWPQYKLPQSMSYYAEQELGFQFALARAFTLCDAYFCSIHTSTNPNRLFMFTGTNDPTGAGGGPVIDNSKDSIGLPETGYTWTTYPERLEAAGVSWKVYQDLADNFSDNPLAGFRQYRDPYFNDPTSPLVRKGLSTTLLAPELDAFRSDVNGGTLPQVSWIVGPAAYSEHPGPSSPIQGAWYTQAVLDALTADPAVWATTVLLVMFDENDGFFDHLPPPSAPSLIAPGVIAGASSVDDATERHPGGLVYGPGPRVPMCVVSPWSRGGWINSETFDHTSLVRLLELRFGVAEPNISPWRRAMLGDLTSAFNFAHPNDERLPRLPILSREEADAIRLEQQGLPPIVAPHDDAGVLPVQRRGVRPSRALPYALAVDASIDVAAGQVTLAFGNTGAGGAVFHVYDRLHLDRIPRRYAVGGGASLTGVWDAEADGSYDLWVLGPNGFLRHFEGVIPSPEVGTAQPEIVVRYRPTRSALTIAVRNDGTVACTVSIVANAYQRGFRRRLTLAPGRTTTRLVRAGSSRRWYDLTISAVEVPGFRRRIAGRIENGRPSVTDPAMGGASTASNA